MSLTCDKYILYLKENAQMQLKELYIPVHNHLLQGLYHTMQQLLDPNIDQVLRSLHGIW